MLFFFYYESVSGLVMREELHGQQWLEGLFLGQYINNKISRKTYNVLPLFSPTVYLADGSIVASCFLIVRECCCVGDCAAPDAGCMLLYTVLLLAVPCGSDICSFLSVSPSWLFGLVFPFGRIPSDAPVFPLHDELFYGPGPGA